MAGHPKTRPLGMIQSQRTKKGMISKAKDIFPLAKDRRHDLKAIDEMQAEGVTNIVPRASIPARKTRLRNRSPVVEEDPEISSSNESALESLQGVDRRGICEDILVGGHVQTFVDFFYLTHRPGPWHDSSDSRQPTQMGVPPTDMLFIRDGLVEAESARRRGETPAVYKAFNSLAQFYQDQNDPKTGVYFHEKCLEMSRLTSDKRGEMSASHRLGSVYEKMGDINTAMGFHERHQELAKAIDVPEEQAMACAELMKVYRKLAEEREYMGDFAVSVEFWAKSLDAAKAAGDRHEEALASYRLGKVYTELAEATRAIKYLEDYEVKATELDDMEGQGKAYQALAAAYQSVGDDDRALSLLQRYLEVSTNTHNFGAQEAACSSLGLLYSKRGEHAKAKDMFERNFMISRKVVDAGGDSVTTELVDVSRAFLGIAAGNEMIAEYMSAVAEDLGPLLDWKSNRVRPRPRPRSKRGSTKVD